MPFWRGAPIRVRDPLRWDDETPGAEAATQRKPQGPRGVVTTRSAADKTNTPSHPPLAPLLQRTAAVSSYDYGMDYLAEIGVQNQSTWAIDAAAAKRETPALSPTANVGQGPSPSSSARGDRSQARSRPRSASLADFIAIEVRRPLSPRSYRERRSREKHSAQTSLTSGLCTSSPGGMTARPVVRDKNRNPRTNGETSVRRQFPASAHSWQHAEDGRMTMTCNFSDDSSALLPTPKLRGQPLPTPKSNKSRMSHVYVRYH